MELPLEGRIAEVHVNNIALWEGGLRVDPNGNIEKSILLELDETQDWQETVKDHDKCSN